MDEQVPETKLRASIANAWDAFRTSKTNSCPSIHSECSVLMLEDIDGAFAVGKPAAICLPNDMIESSMEILHLQITPAGKQSSSLAKVRIGTKYTGFLVFLKERELDDVIWKCISVTVGAIHDEPILPSSYEQVNHLTWDGYCHANGICDGELMSKYFHSSCRLTYSGQDDRVTICDSGEFYAKVSGRYEHEAIHKPYAHFKNDPRLGDANTLISTDFASSQIAMVVLKVGHPPFLWTDILTCARIKTDGKIQWWIVHKSSDSERHPLIS